MRLRKAMYARAAIGFHGHLAEQLREFSGGASAQQIHLEVTFLRMHIAQRPGHIQAIGGSHDDRAQCIAFDAGGCAQARRCDRAIQLRQTGAQAQPDAGDGQHRDG